MSHIFTFSCIVNSDQHSITKLVSSIEQCMFLLSLYFSMRSVETSCNFFISQFFSNIFRNDADLVAVRAGCTFTAWTEVRLFCIFTCVLLVFLYANFYLYLCTLMRVLSICICTRLLSISTTAFLPALKLP